VLISVVCCWVMLYFFCCWCCTNARLFSFVGFVVLLLVYFELC